MAVQPSVEASVSQGELEPVIQVQLELVLGVLLEMSKFTVYAAWKRETPEILCKKTHVSLLFSSVRRRGLQARSTVDHDDKVRQRFDELFSAMFLLEKRSRDINLRYHRASGSEKW